MLNIKSHLARQTTESPFLLTRDGVYQVLMGFLEIVSRQEAEGTAPMKIFLNKPYW